MFKIKRTQFPFFTLVLICFLFPAKATTRAPTLPSDVDYYIHESPTFSLIFSHDFLNPDKDFLYLHKKLSYYDDVYKEVFTEELNEKPVYIFASSRNQKTNASAFSIPFLRVVFFPSGVSAFDMAVDSYVDTLISHEMAHIFQLGQISNKIRYLKLLFKNSNFILIPFPVFLNPNLSFSLFFLEGHAMLSESLFAKGGRMYSGSTRALVFSQIKNKFQNINQFNKNYLLNITEDTWAHQQPYVHGGYFFSSLLDLYDIKTINNIFKRHAEHFVVPLSFISVKDSFESSFQVSFESLANYYIQKYLPLAVQQSVSKEKALFKSRVCPPFNKKNDEVFFLTSDLRSSPALRSFSISTGQWKKSKKSLPIGKPFKIEKNYYVSANGAISPVERVYGLFSEGMYLKSHKSQKVFDIKQGQVLSMSSGNNMRSLRLLLNGEFYNNAHSSALFGPDGGVYYFKQRGDYKVMYRNKSPLFQFVGFYGKPMEISLNGTIYFIASSLYGSTLFGWTPEEGIYRVSPSDTIIEAIAVGDNQFLVCELGADFYEYKIIKTNKILQQPVFYKYPFRQISHSLSTLSNLSAIHHKQIDSVDTKITSTPQQEEDQDYLKSLGEATVISDPHSRLNKQEANITLDLENASQEDSFYSTYHSLKYIKFNGIDLGIFRDLITGFSGFINIGFRDYMEYSLFKFTVQRAFSMPNWAFKAYYLNRAGRLSWNLQYIYKQGLENFFGARDHTYIHELSQGFSFPLFKVGYWQSSVSLTNALAIVEFKKRLGYQHWYWIAKPFWQIQYKKSYRKNFDYHRHFFLKTAFDYHLKILKAQPHFLFKVRSHYKIHWGWDFYTKPFVNYKTALRPKSVPFRYFDSITFFNTPEIGFSLRQKVFEQTNNYLSLGLQAEKFIITPLYFARYPFSIDGLAPMVQATYVQFLNNTSLNKNKELYMSFLEWTFGMSFLILFHHKIKLRLSLLTGFSHPIAPFSYPSRPSKKQRLSDGADKKKNRAINGGHFQAYVPNGSTGDFNHHWFAGLRIYSRF